MSSDSWPPELREVVGQAIAEAVAEQQRHMSEVIRAVKLQEKLTAIAPILGVIADQLNSILDADVDLAPELGAAARMMGEACAALTRAGDFVEARARVRLGLDDREEADSDGGS